MGTSERCWERWPTRGLALIGANWWWVLSVSNFNIGLKHGWRTSGNTVNPTDIESVSLVSRDIRICGVVRNRGRPQSPGINLESHRIILQLKSTLSYSPFCVISFIKCLKTSWKKITAVDYSISTFNLRLSAEAFLKEILHHLVWSFDSQDTRTLNLCSRYSLECWHGVFVCLYSKNDSLSFKLLFCKTHGTVCEVQDVHASDWSSLHPVSQVYSDSGNTLWVILGNGCGLVKWWERDPVLVTSIFHQLYEETNLNSQKVFDSIRIEDSGTHWKINNSSDAIVHRPYLI